MHTLEPEPLCNLEQSQILKELNFNEPTNYSYCNLNMQEEWRPEPERVSEKHNSYERYISRPTISMAKNWIYEKYGVWIQTCANTLDWFLSSSPNNKLQFESSYYDIGLMSAVIVKTNSPYASESECLTNILKQLKEKNHV
jgi:hypothetical protein